MCNYGCVCVYVCACAHVCTVQTQRPRASAQDNVCILSLPCLGGMAALSGTGLDPLLGIFQRIALPARPAWTDQPGCELTHVWS